MPSLSVIILTLNEELNLPACLASLCNLDAEVFVVDCGSSDRTVEIARQSGAKVVVHAFESHARQFNWALDRLPLSAPWVMRLDADERLTPELVQELQTVLTSASEGITGFLVKRRIYFWGRWIRHGGYYPTWLLRIWRNGKGRCEDIWMDEHIVVTDGVTRPLQADIIDENRKGLAFWIAKHNGYSDRAVKGMLAPAGVVSGRQIGAQAARRRFLKETIYANAPPVLRAFLYWAFRYFLLLGFLDGKPGFVFHFLQGLWYRLIIDAKLYELERQTPSGAPAANRKQSMPA